MQFSDYLIVRDLYRVYWVMRNAAFHRSVCFASITCDAAADPVTMWRLNPVVYFLFPFLCPSECGGENRGEGSFNQVVLPEVSAVLPTAPSLFEQLIVFNYQIFISLFLFRNHCPSYHFSFLLYKHSFIFLIARWTGRRKLLHFEKKIKIKTTKKKKKDEL